MRTSNGASDWTLEVANLGPIPRATLTLRPLTLFVGENNSGKTWLSSLIWGLHTRRFAESMRARDREDWLRLRAEMSSIFQSAADAVAADAPLPTGVLGAGWTEVAAALRDHAVHEVARQVVPAGASGLRVTLATRREAIPWRGYKVPLPVQSRQDQIALAGIHVGPESWGGQGVPYRGWAFGAGASDFSGGLVDNAVESTLAWLAGGPNPPCSSSSPGYLVASRSSFLQLLPLIAQRSVRGIVRGSEPADADTAAAGLSPQVGWLAELLLSRPKVRVADFEDLADALEQRVLRGSVMPNTLNPAAFDFAPAGGAAIPIAEASSLVTELAPVVHMLRSSYVPDFLVFEEPEAHLHPTMQRILARVLVRLVNRGVRLLVSTHSDLFAQEINNCIKLASARERLDEADYSALVRDVGCVDEEALDVASVAAYGFVRDATTSAVAVERLFVGAGGVDMPTFNTELRDLNNAIDRLEASLDAA